MMNRWKPRSLTCALIMAATLMAMPASAQQGSGSSAPAGQPPNLQTALANDVGTLSEKFAGPDPRRGRQI
jgi:hypothetical protein